MKTLFSLAVLALFIATPAMAVQQTKTVTVHMTNGGDLRSEESCWDFTGNWNTGGITTHCPNRGYGPQATETTHTFQVSVPSVTK